MGKLTWPGPESVSREPVAAAVEEIAELSARFREAVGRLSATQLDTPDGENKYFRTTLYSAIASSDSS